MVQLETVDELAKALADMLGIYGIPRSDTTANPDHPEDCPCKICFVSEISNRIRSAVSNDKLLKVIYE